MGIGMGISSLPVVARILAERKMLQDQLGTTVMIATAISKPSNHFIIKYF